MTLSRRRFASMLLGASAVLTGGGAALAAGEAPVGMLNIFISPAGKPFRAPIQAPYPVVDWFKEADKDGDGKIDHREFMADAEAFFKVLDRSGAGVLNSYDIQVYERVIAPEILGYMFKPPEARLTPKGLFGGQMWLAQMGGVGGMGGMGATVPGSIDPSGPAEPSGPKILHDLDETEAGASPFSLFDEPEPVMAADFNFNGRIKKENFLKLADMHFTRLDTQELGYLTLDKLPKTAVQKRLEKGQRRRR